MDLMDVLLAKKLGGGGGGESVQSDWSVGDSADPAYVKNRTHYEDVVLGDTLTWDGTPTDVSIDLGWGMYLYKVSDVVLTQEDCENGYTVIFDDRRYDVSGEDAQSGFLDGGVWMGYEGAAVSIPADNMDLTDIYGVVFPQKGLYFAKEDSEFDNIFVSTLIVPGMTTLAAKVPVPLADKYIPDTIQRKLTGTAGQFVVIGDDGNPTTLTLTNVAEVGA